VQLRTGKLGFRSFLFHRNVPEVEDPNCECGEELTVSHVKLDCTSRRDIRATALEGLNRKSPRKPLFIRNGYLAAARMVEQTELQTQFQRSELGMEAVGAGEGGVGEGGIGEGRRK
jgi:hypothetical protein